MPVSSFNTIAGKEFACARDVDVELLSSVLGHEQAILVGGDKPTCLKGGDSFNEGIFPGEKKDGGNEEKVKGFERL